MKKITNIFHRFFGVLLTLAVVCFGGGAEVLMAATGDLPEGGKTGSGAPRNSDGETLVVETPAEIGGISSITQTEALDPDNPEYYDKDLTERVLKIRPYSTPIDQITRKARTSATKSIVVRYYSVSARPIRATVTSKMTAMTTGASAILTVDDPAMFTIDDTIRVVGVKGVYDEDGVAYATKYADSPNLIPDLVLCVCGYDTATSMPIVYAVNGNKNTAGQTIYSPEIPVGTVLIRMGKACSEIDRQTGRFSNVPEPDEQYCQNFMMQIEQSTFEKMSRNEANWTFSDVEEDAIYDMRRAQEATYLFGVKRKINHVTKNAITWFTGGIWWLAGRDIEIGHWTGDTSVADAKLVVDSDDLVDMIKELNTGTSSGNHRKIIAAGSNVIAAFEKVDSEKFRKTQQMKFRDLEFTGWKSAFGEVMIIYHEAFDEMGMADYAFAFDPVYLVKKVFVSYGKSILDLKKAGIRNTDGFLFQEVCCLILRYPQAHARMKLAAQPVAPEPDDDEEE